MLEGLICCSIFNILKSCHVRVLHSHTQGSEQIFTVFRFLPIDRCCTIRLLHKGGWSQMVKRMPLQLPRDIKIFIFMYVRVTNNNNNENTINEWPVLGLQHFNNNNKENY
jgi:hypothetical protein